MSTPIRISTLITDVGCTSDGSTWCTLDRSIFRPGDTGHVGPFRLLNVGHSSDGELIHFLKPGADPLVGEVVGLSRDQRPLSGHPGLRAG